MSNQKKNIRLFRPLVGEEELLSIENVINESWLGLGEYVTTFEQEWSTFLGSKSSVGLNSATAALHLALAVYGFTKGKKVLVPSMTFISTAAAPIYNHLEPIFVDCDKDSMTMDVNDLQKKYTKECVAIMPVHFGGEPCRMEEITSFAKLKNLKVIEDCAHTQGGEYLGKKLGLWGDIGCFSFEEKKGMTTGDGGVACSDDEDLLETMRPMRWVGIDKDTWKRSAEYTDSKASERHWYYQVDTLGYKYNMNNLSASIGLAQLQRIDEINSSKTQTIKRYLSGIKNLSGLEPLLPYSQINSPKSSYWLFGLRCQKRNSLLRFLKNRGIATGVHYTPINLHPYFKNFPGYTPTASLLYDEICTLPLYPGMLDEDVDYVLEALEDFSDKFY
jgi:perosamine synthetase